MIRREGFADLTYPGFMQGHGQNERIMRMSVTFGTWPVIWINRN